MGEEWKFTDVPRDILELAASESGRGMATVYDPLTETRYAVPEDRAKEEQEMLNRRATEGFSVRPIGPPQWERYRNGGEQEGGTDGG